MSEIKADALTGKTAAGNVTVTSEGGAVTFQLQQGLAKAWVNFNGTGTIAARDSLNVSGLTDNGTGDYTVSYSNSMSAAYIYAVSHYTAYSGAGQLHNNRITGSSDKLASSIRVATGYISSLVGNIGASDDSENNYIVHGDLA